LRQRAFSMSQTVTETLRLVITAQNDQATAQLKQTTAAIKDFGAKAKQDAEAVKKQFEALDHQLAQTQRSASENLGKAGKAAKQMGTDTQKAGADAGHALTQAKQKTEQLAQSTTATAATVKTGMQAVGTEAQKAGLQVEQGTSKARESAKKTGEEIGQMSTKGAKSFKDLASASTVAFTAITVSVGLATKAFGDLQQQLNTLKAVSGASEQEMDAIHAKAMALGQTSGFMSTEVASAGVELAKLGFTSQEVIDSLSGIVSAAAASGTSLAQAGELVAGTIRGFGLSAKDAAMVADILAQAANASALGFEDMALSMKYIAPIAQASGQKLTDMVGIMGVLSNSMIKGETAGTALRSMMVSLQAPSGQAMGYIKKLGLEVADAEGKIKPLPVLIGELQDKLGKFNQKSQNKILAEIFGAEALPAVSVLMKTSKESLAEMIAQMENASGASKEMASVMQQGINAELSKLSAKANTLAQDMGERLAPALEEVVKFLAGFLDIISKLPDPVKDTAVQVGLLAAAVTGLGIAFGGAIAGGGKLLNLLKGLVVEGGALARLAPLLLGPAGLIGLGVGAVANIGLNVAASQYNAEADRQDEYAKTTGEKNNTLIKSNQLTRLANAGQLGSLSREQLQASLEDLKKQQEAHKELLKGEKELADLKRQLADRQGSSRTQSLTEFDQAPAQDPNMTRLSQQIAEKEKFLESSRETLLRAHQTVEKNEKLIQQVSAALKQKPAPSAGSENLGEDNRQQVKDTEAYFEKLKTNRENLKLELQKVAADQTHANTALAGSNDKLAQRLIANAEKTATQTSQCFKAVYKTYVDTFGDGGQFDKMTGKVGDNPVHAADAANRLAQDKRFREVDINAQNYQQVMGSLKGPSIIVYDRGAGFTDMTKIYGHIETYDPKTGQGYFGRGSTKRNMTPGLAEHARVFEMAGVSGSKDMRENLAEQKILNQLMDAYNADIAKAIAYRNQLPAQSEAWKKADSEVTKMQQEAAQIGIDLTKKKADLEEKYREAAIRWAQERLAIEAATLDAQTKLTADTVDDIEATYKATLASIAAEEIERLAREGTTEEQRLKLKKMYDLKRQVAEKEHSSAIQAERYRLARATEDLLMAGEQAQTALMQEGLEKEIRLSKLREDAERTGLQRQLQDMALKGQAETDDYALLQLKLTDLTQQGEKERAEIRRQFFHRRKLDELTSQQGQVDLNLRESLAGQRDPDTIEHLQTQAMKQKLELQEQISGEIWAQLESAKAEAQSKGQSIALSEKIYQLQQQLTASERTETEFKLQAQEMLFQALERERQIRQQITQDLLRATDMGVEGFAKMLGLQQGIGNQVATWVNMLQQGVGLLKDEKGNPLELLNVFGANGKGGVNGLGGAAASSLGVEAVGPITAIASQLNNVKEQFVGWLNNKTMENIYAHDPVKIKAKADALKAQLVQIDLEIQDARIAQAKARGTDTFAMERAQVVARGQAELDELGRQWREVTNKKSAWGGLEYTPEEQKARAEFEKTMPSKRLAIEEKTQATLLQMEKQRLQDVLEANAATAQAIADARFNAETESAALTPGTKDDLAAERKRREAEVWKTYLGRLNTGMEQFAKTGQIDPSLITAAGKEKDAGLDALDHDLRMKALAEEGRVRSELAQTRELEIRANLKGAAQEIELLREKIRLEQAALEDQLKNPNLDPREREAKETRLKLLENALDKGLSDTQRKWANAAANAALDLQGELAKGTQSGLDDAVAEHAKAMEQISQAESDARENLTGKQLTDTLNTLKNRRINAEVEIQKKLKQIWAEEYSERLNQQKTLIQESMELERQALEQHIREAQDRMRPLQEDLKQLQRDVEASRRQREAEKTAFDPEDAQQSAKFREAMASFNPDAAAWSGVGDISNPENLPGLPNVSGETARLGLLKQAEVTERRASNAFRREEIDKATYVQRMQDAQLMRAKAAEMELKTEGLKTEKILDLEEEWANAYVKYQELASQAIDARYDADDKRTQASIDLKQMALQTEQDAIDKWQQGIDAMNRAAEEKIRPIDDELRRVEQSTRDWAGQWSNVSEGIAVARKEMESLLASAQRLPNTSLGAQNASGGSGGASSGAGGSAGRYIPTVASKYDANGQRLNEATDSRFTVQGKNGQWYQSEADRQAAEDTNMAAGGGIRNPKAKGDRFAANLDDWETVVPLNKWGEFLAPFLRDAARPYLPKSAGQTVIVNKTAMVTGNSFSSNVDVTRAVASALEDRLGIIHDNVAFLG
jgi:TP901 family phage tail tape measure protein